MLKKFKLAVKVNSWFTVFLFFALLFLCYSLMCKKYSPGAVVLPAGEQGLQAHEQEASQAPGLEATKSISYAPEPPASGLTGQGVGSGAFNSFTPGVAVTCTPSATSECTSQVGWREWIAWVAAWAGLLIPCTLFLWFVVL